MGVLACVLTSVMCESLRAHRLQPARLLCPWDCPDKNTGVGCHALVQGIFLTQGSNCISYASCTGRRALYHWRHLFDGQRLGMCSMLRQTGLGVVLPLRCTASSPGDVADVLHQQSAWTPPPASLRTLGLAPQMPDAWSQSCPWTDHRAWKGPWVCSDAGRLVPVLPLD